jgi:ligand-binding sensor domain-containing protein
VLSKQGTVRECGEIGVPFWEDNPFVSSRIKAIAFDDSERPHLLFSAENRRGDVVAHGILVDNGSALCQTVNVLDPNYPFKVLNLNDNTRPQRPSPSADVIAAGGNDIWLFGSDGGVARVVDEVGQGLCPDVIPITYAPVMRRQDGAEDNRLLTNTVPALVPSAADGVLWWGTFLGLQRLQDGQFTTIPFDRAPTVNVSQADTLEGLFREVAQAIFEAQPLTTVAVGDISLAAIFDTSAFVKEDFDFSAVEDARGRLWVGTLGGGMRRVEACDGKWRDTLHLTRTQMVIAPCEGERRRIRQEGDQRQRVFLGSNIILALAVGQNDAIWAVTTEGVSHIREDDAEVTVTNITALEGLTASIVRDVAIGQDGTVWLATNIGPFRIIPREN